MRRDVRILLVGDGEHLARSERYMDRLMPFLTRGRGEEYHRHLSHQGVICRTCELGLHVAVQANLKCIQVQHIVPEVTIPPEVTPENVTTYIVDSGG